MAEVAPQTPHLRILNGPQQGTCIPLDFNALAITPFVIGRAPDSNFLLQDPTNRVSRHHSEFAWRKEDEVLTLRDTSSNGTYLNGQQIGSLMPLFPGDIIGCGSIQLLFFVPVDGIKTLLAQLPDEKHMPEDTWPGVARLDVLVSDARNLRVGSFIRLIPTHPLSIGRFGDNDLQLLDEDVSRSHAEIRWISNGYVLRDLGAANPTYINDVALDAPRRLQDGDTINIRGSEFSYRASRVPYQVSTKLEAVKITSQRLRFALDHSQLHLGARFLGLPRDRQVQIGRSESNDLRLLDPYVSKRHAILVYESGRYVLTDLGTSNGVLVNGQDIKRPIALNGGDRLKIGQFEFIFEDYEPSREDGQTVMLRSGQPVTLEMADSTQTIADSGSPDVAGMQAVKEEKNLHPLRKIPPFDELDDELFKQLQPYFKQVTYNSEQEIAREGQGKGAFFAVLSGYITISRALNERRDERLVLAEIGPGAIYGERTIFANQPFVNRLVARTRVEALRLEESDFVRTFSNNPKILSFFQQQVATYSTATWLRGTILMRTLSDRTIRDLAARMRYRSFKPGELIGEKDKPCDQFFLIVGGEATAFTVNSKGTEQVIAELEEGDTFGDGIASEGETYPVTVRARKLVDAYALAKADFETVLSQSADPVANLGAELLGLPLGAVLNRISPFTTMPPQLVAQIAARMKVKKFPKGRVIFKEGERADAFYIIRKGQIELSFQTRSGENRTDMTIGPGQFFGETALSDNPTRTNTCHAVEEVQLLTLYRPQFEEVLKLGGNYALGQYFAKGISKRYRPKRVADWSITEQTNAMGETQHLLSKGEDYFKLSEGGYFLWQLMDGDNSINDLALSYFMEFKSLDLEGVSNLVGQLQAAGFLEVPKVDERLLGEKQGKERSIIGKLWQPIFRTLTYTTEIKNVDGFFTGLYRYFGRVFFWKPLVFLFALIVLAGTAAFVWKGGLSALVQPPIALFATGLWWILILVLLFNFFIHEIAHGLACKHFGRKVMGVGVGWNLVGPVFLVDTNQIWLEKRWPRIVVNLAGPLTNILFCNICFLWLFLVSESDTHTRDALFQLGVIAFTLAYINLNPLVEGDGYYALMDWVEIPSLRKKALVHVRRRLTRKPDVRHYTQREKRIFNWFVAFIPIYLLVIMAQFIFWLGGITIALLHNSLNFDSDTSLWLGVGLAVIVTLLMAIPMFGELFVISAAGSGDDEDDTVRTGSARGGRRQNR
ncbi:MAG: FHA domain-containing protein [Chloroflexi bacterium]|uniref:FHA domain-containing protein n=1 Tax=Candidatus Chlorohelix allophototropha TaxID=3003348 RepID=A0A8T7M8D4_9CHLR|nr:FHA domain-containing protein [Chloroflexota bacterium]WJW68148.1 FHA domain-containing protein [Chloroflexota bacterium L227-S17]